MDDIYFMKCAMNEALKAFKIGDVPIGCVIVKDNKIISTYMFRPFIVFLLGYFIVFFQKKIFHLR